MFCISGNIAPSFDLFDGFYSFNPFISYRPPTTAAMSPTNFIEFAGSGDVVMFLTSLNFRRKNSGKADALHLWWTFSKL
jgi:hypothetical protein